MARKPAAKPKTSKARKAAALPARGPLTLGEAENLLAQKRTPAAKRRARLPAAPVDAMAAERTKLAKRQADESARRRADYKAKMTLLTRRGLRAPDVPLPSQRGARLAMTMPVEPSLLAAAGSRPLRILADGDSWFDYPPFATSYMENGAEVRLQGGVIGSLQYRLGVPIMNEAAAGDEVRYMLGVRQREKLARLLQDQQAAGTPWDVLLFSGGGNDIVGDPLVLCIKPWQSGAAPAALVDQPRFTAVLALIRAGYEDLIAMRDALSPDTHILLHGYDFAFADNRGICGVGPWLWPSFRHRGFPAEPAASAVVKVMLQQFAAMLAGLAGPKVTVVPTQGALRPVKTSWHNELHPSRDGFSLVTDLFHEALRSLFPGRVA